MNISIEQLFDQARTHNGFRDEAIPESTLRRLWDTLKWGPTSANCSPMRLVFVQSAEAKAKLLPCVSTGNHDKVKHAPVTVIVGMDMAFYENLPRLFPHTDARSWFVGKPELTETTAFRNSSLQGGYLILAARALGLDCGPMSGFDNAKVDGAFFAGTAVKSNFICNLGHGDSATLHPRNPRLSFDEACRLA